MINTIDMQRLEDGTWIVATSDDAPFVPTVRFWSTADGEPALTDMIRRGL